MQKRVTDSVLGMLILKTAEGGTIRRIEFDPKQHEAVRLRGSQRSYNRLGASVAMKVELQRWLASDQFLHTRLYIETVEPGL